MDIFRTIEKLRASIRDAAAAQSDFSAWSVGTHIEHCALAMSGVCQSLKESGRPAPASGWSLLRCIVLTTGIIPRGRGKAPAQTVPGEHASAEKLSEMLDQAEAQLRETLKLDKNCWFKHHVFGVLKRDAAIRFLAIHNRHHLKIIGDICGLSAC